ncbi:ABC transporter permease [Natrinema salifodinae]|uniref:Tungstate transport system permease protein n=1 Tax=Natrinema salifodinae TaxID=1202768 RepID=A0A1I0N9Q4_9EURY|nr:ABC transporter permease [Natrinema salifodinae]SEV97603.1 tungstate transport system permease protein [Natrinema salifodinae]
MVFETISDPVYLRSIVRISLTVSLIAVLLSTVLSLPVAFAVGFADFRGKRLVTAAINTGMGFPSVVVGLLVWYVLSNQGPLGTLNLIYTPEAMIVSQCILAAPVITGVALSAVESVDDTVRDAAYGVGGTRADVALITLKEARYGVITGILAGFGRAISEVGSVLIVGGNIAYADGTSKTRTITTAIQFEVRKGEFEIALVLGAVLLVLVLLVNGIVLRLGGR